MTTAQPASIARGVLAVLLLSLLPGLATTQDGPAAGPQPPVMERVWPDGLLLPRAPGHALPGSDELRP